MSKQEHYRPDLPWKIDGCFDAEINRVDFHGGRFRNCRMLAPL